MRRNAAVAVQTYLPKQGTMTCWLADNHLITHRWPDKCITLFCVARSRQLQMLGFSPLQADRQANQHRHRPAWTVAATGQAAGGFWLAETRPARQPAVGRPFPGDEAAGPSDWQPQRLLGLAGLAHTLATGSDITAKWSRSIDAVPHRQTSAKSTPRLFQTR